MTYLFTSGAEIGRGLPSEFLLCGPGVSVSVDISGGWDRSTGGHHRPHWEVLSAPTVGELVL